MALLSYKGPLAVSIAGTYVNISKIIHLHAKTNLSKRKPGKEKFSTVGNTELKVGQHFHAHIRVTVIGSNERLKDARIARIGENCL